MKIPLSFAKKLLKVFDGETLRSEFTSSLLSINYFNRFIDEGILKAKPHRNTQLIYGNTENIINFLKKEYGITDLEKYIETLENEDADKSHAAEFASDTKVLNKRSFEGFFIRTYDNFNGIINGQKIVLNPPKGSWIYIVDYKNFTIENDITIIGIENPETFRYIENYKYLFSTIKPLFLLRFNNNLYIEWLQSIENKYLHFGDFDLSALAIYIHEFRNKLGENRCSFFIPKNIEQLIMKSENRDLYLKQLNDKRVKNIKFENYPEISELALLIKKHQTTLEQEFFKVRN
jgi:hypothetical protein